MSVYFFDFEASGLHATSHPVEVAWVSHDLTQGWSTIIRPAPTWLEQDVDPISEDIHGIPRQQAIAKGMDVVQVAARLNANLAHGDLFTDNPGFDFRWLRMVFDAAQIKPAFTIPPSVPAGRAWEPFEQVAYDRMNVDVLVMGAAKRAQATMREIEFITGQMADKVGLVSHRAIDDAIRHALSLGSGPIKSLASH